MSYWKLQKELGYEDFSFLEDEYKNTELSAYDFLHGFCTCFAYSLFLKLGGIIVKVGSYTTPCMHCYLKITQNNNIYFIDIRGKVKAEEELLEEFELSYKNSDESYFYYKNIDDYYFWTEYKTKKQIEYFYNYYVKGEDIALKNADIFIETNKDFYF